MPPAGSRRRISYSRRSATGWPMCGGSCWIAAGSGAPSAHARGVDMRVLVVFVVNAQSAFSIPGYSSEQTCSAKGKEIIAVVLREKGGNWVYHCVKPE